MVDVLNIDYVLCPYCEAEGIEKRLKMVTKKHLSTHNKNLEDAKNDFPNVSMICKKSSDKKKEIGNKCSTANKMKLIKCFHCKEEIEVRNNTANKQLCLVCLEKWKNGNTSIENPDGRSKSSANENRSNTMLKTYGVTNCRHIDGVEEKIKKTNNEVHGGTGFGSKELAKKSNDTMEKEYGERNWYQTDEGREQAKEQLNSDEANLKSGNSRKGMVSHRLGKKIHEIIAPDKVDGYLQNLSDKHKKNFLQEFDEKLKYFQVECVDDYNGARDTMNFKCIICDTEFESNWNYIQQGKSRCPECHPRMSGKSIGEQEIVDYIKSLDNELEIIQNDRKIIYPKEIDIYIPKFNIAIEYDGMYMHSEFCHYRKDKKFDPKYHLMKTNACEEKGIRLIHITDHQWIHSNNIIKNTLKQILGYNDGIRIHARKCIIKEIEPSVKNEFLEKHHLQGKDSSTIKLGAFFEDDLISTMTFSKPNFTKSKKDIKGVWVLNRFAIKENIRISGIAGKLLSYFKNNFPWFEIHTMADRSWSKGDLYHKLGFTFAGYTELDYSYVDTAGNVYSRQSQRKRKDEPIDIPEWELRRREDRGRYFGCGNLRFIIKNDNSEIDLSEYSFEKPSFPLGIKVSPCVNCGKDVEHLMNLNPKGIVCQECKSLGFKVNLMKTVKCYYCKEEFEISQRASKEYSVCPKCKLKGLKNPKASEHAKMAKRREKKNNVDLLKC